MRRDCRGHADLEARLSRRERLLQVAATLAAEGDPELILNRLLSEAVALLDGTDGTISRWNETRRILIAVRRHAPRAGEPPVLRPGQGACGRAIERRAPIVVEDYQAECGAETRGGPGGVRTAVAAPLVHEGHLLGAVVVYRYTRARPFTVDDGDVLGLLSASAAAALVGLERARLEGALLAARTAQHELKNQLSLTTGYAELLSLNPDLPPHLRAAALEALRGAEAAVRIVNQLQQMTHLEQKAWGVRLQPTIDLDRSTG